MVWISNANADNASAPETVPEDTYSVEVADVIEKETRAGDAMWRLSLRIIGGPYGGKIINDFLVFSERGIPKALAMLKAVGLDVTGGRDYQPSEVNGRKCRVTTYVKEMVDEDGFPRRVNQVPFTGYGPPIEIDGRRPDAPGR
ncbi:MAG: hypothetical protein C0404_14130 [Verrucomicrobia bacterium]|nr:hypothetical protein [Verrucomicrobiota bacterium]